MTNPIVHFEIPADDVERAKTFYNNIFGWKIEKFDMPDGEAYWMVFTTEIDDKMKATSPGINGGLMKKKDSQQPFMNYISVKSIDDTNKKIEEKNGEIIMQKTEIAPGMGWLSTFKDTEGNIIGLHEEAKKD